MDAKNMIDRNLYPEIEKRLFGGKAILLIGPRQVGKTTLIKEILKDLGEKYLFLDGDDPTVRDQLDNPNTERIRQIIGQFTVVFIDEAQRISNIGLTSKIIVDQFPEKQLILSGSSAFELGENMQEPLTGRKWTYQLYPISWNEWENHNGFMKAEQDFENRLIYGFYPDVLNHPREPEDILSELVDSYLYKDILNYAGIRKPEKIQKLVQAIAYQVGQEVVYKEVGDLVGLDPKTVSNYIDILEKAYVLFSLPSFSRNLRNEIKRNRKIYFYDNGVRNAVINAFHPIENRQDIGALWENFLISERLKLHSYYKIRSNRYFWRTKQQQEVDYVEELDGNIFGFEFKWSPKRKIRFPKTFVKNYNATVKGVNRDNFREFLSL
ncbi:MAG: ATP-binding protein [Balneolaceae bacterium]|nr:ATP-binding protein [Balneolaceae bacterium]